MCKIVGGKITLNSEADKIEYFDIKKLPKNMSENHLERIMDAVANIPFAFKQQSGKGSREIVAEIEKAKK